MINAERFDIDKFIKNAKEMNLMPLFEHCQSELKWLFDIKFTKASPYTEIKWQVEKYREFIHELAFILHNGIKPSGMQIDDFQKTKPIIESLVSKNQLKSGILDIYNESK